MTASGTHPPFAGHRPRKASQMTTTHRFPTAVHAGLEQGGTLLRLVDRSGNAYEFEMDDVALFELTRASTTLINPLRHKPAAATPPFLVVIDPIQSRLEDRDAVPLVVRAGSREMANSIPDTDITSGRK